MECDRIKDILFEYADTEIPPAFRESVEAHLAGCPSCAHQRELLNVQLNSIRSLPRIQAPSDFLFKVRREMEKPSLFTRGTSTLFSFIGRRYFLRFASTAAVALLVVATTHFALRETSTQKALLISPPAEAPSSSPASPIREGSLQGEGTREKSNGQAPAPGAAEMDSPVLEKQMDSAHSLPDIAIKKKATEIDTPASPAARAVAPVTPPAKKKEFKYGGQFRARSSTPHTVDITLRLRPAPVDGSADRKEDASRSEGALARKMRSVPHQQAPPAALEQKRRAGSLSVHQDAPEPGPLPSAGPKEDTTLDGVKGIIHRSSGRILSEIPSSSGNSVESLSIDIPAQNYPAFLKDLRLFGEIDPGEKVEVDSHAGAMIRVNLKFMHSR